MLNSINARRNQVNQLRDVAQANLDKQSSEQAAEQRFNITEQNADARAVAQQQHDELMTRQKQQTEDFKQAKSTTETDLARLQQQKNFIDQQVNLWHKANPNATSSQLAIVEGAARTVAYQKFPARVELKPSTIVHPKTQHAPSSIMVQKQNDLKRQGAHGGLVPPPPPTVPSAGMWSDDQLIQVQEAKSRGLLN